MWDKEKVSYPHKVSSVWIKTLKQLYLNFWWAFHDSSMIIFPNKKMNPKMFVLQDAMSTISPAPDSLSFKMHVTLVKPLKEFLLLFDLCVNLKIPRSSFCIGGRRNYLASCRVSIEKFYWSWSQSGCYTEQSLCHPGPFWIKLNTKIKLHLLL